MRGRSCEYHCPRGLEGAHPGRNSYVWNVTIPLGSGRITGAGKPTVREAQFPSGQWMTKKRMPAAEQQQENETPWSASPLTVSYNWPDTG
jgi:hypothetical protein